MKKIKYLYFETEFCFNNERHVEVIAAPVDKINSFSYRKDTNELYINVNGSRYKVLFDESRKDWLDVSKLVPEILRFLDMDLDDKDCNLSLDIETIVDSLA